MKKILILIGFTVILACQEAPKDYVTFSGTITNKNSDSLVVSNREYSKTITVNADGTFSDTLQVKPGIYNVFDGNEFTRLYLENGYDLNMTIDTKMFDETVKYTGKGSENSNFLAAKSIKEEALLNIDELSKLKLENLDSALSVVENKLKTFYNSNTAVDTTLVNSAIADLQPTIKQYREFIVNNINLRTNLPKGAASPTFKEFENYGGTTTSFEDLKGKYAYIDVWATWCGPCKAEIPALKTLEADYHDKNINFVSISIDDDRTHGGSWDKAREDWKAMVADKNLVGIQLFAPNGWQTDFIKEYYINGIPRFILIDPKGNIVTPNAPKPSDPAIRTLFNELSL